ncbi:MAG: hypothetical protein ACD_19C00426G0099 [uncultured bacterium]|nr:MAG: hypothetical protein ACD_19C00426G0099 [uncultured bacterium]
MNTTAQVKQAIKKSAQQMVSEPLELLKNASRQITGEEEIPNAGPEIPRDKSDPDSHHDEETYKKQVIEQDGRHLEALESELKDIRRQKLFNDLMRRIQAGEDIPLEEFTELSYEQRDVLKAQIEAVKKTNSQQLTANSQIDMPQAKRGRKMGGGQKGAAKKEQTRVEKPVPPSG